MCVGPPPFTRVAEVDPWVQQQVRLPLQQRVQLFLDRSEVVLARPRPPRRKRGVKLADPHAACREVVDGVGRPVAPELGRRPAIEMELRTTLVNLNSGG
jgi:hypothetical protein